jgi:hypothetical protein
MRAFEIGTVLPTMQYGADRTAARWPEIRDVALRAEAVGFNMIAGPACRRPPC